MTLAPLARIMIEPLVRAALLEDLGRAGDLTTDAIVPAGFQARTVLVARENGVVAGLDLAKLAFELLDPLIVVRVECEDGATVAPGDVIARVSGPARGILTSERTALNFLGQLSGIASATASIVAAVQGTKAEIVCTRKTMPSSSRTTISRSRGAARRPCGGLARLPAISLRSKSKPTLWTNSEWRSEKAPMPCFSTIWAWRCSPRLSP